MAVAPRVTLRRLILPVGVKLLLKVQNCVPFAGMVVCRVSDGDLGLVPQLTESSDHLPRALGLGCSVISYVPGPRSGAAAAGIPSLVVTIVAFRVGAVELRGEVEGADAAVGDLLQVQPGGNVIRFVYVQVTTSAGGRARPSPRGCR